MILVCGGTGFIGSAAVRALRRDGHDVAVLTRDPSRRTPPAEGVRLVSGDLQDLASLEAAMSGCDGVVQAVQFDNYPMEDPARGRTFDATDREGTRRVAQAAKAAGVRHLVYVSGAGAASDSPYPWNRAKQAGEQAVRESGLDFTILRPSWVYGPEDRSLNRFLGFARWLPFVPVIGDGKSQLTPAFIDDVGLIIARSFTTEAVRNRTMEVGGPDRVTMDEVIRRALAASGKRRFLLHQPAPLMKAAAALIQHLPGRPLTPGAIDFITMDGVAGHREAEESFGIAMTPLDEGLRSYLAPRGRRTRS